MKKKHEQEHENEPEKQELEHKIMNWKGLELQQSTS